jgi:glycosyltransferase
MNKGLKIATGDIIGILNADDFYTSNDVISKVMHNLSGLDNDGVYSDLVYVDKNEPSKIIRYWKAGVYAREKFKWGWMPPHPTVFLRRNIYEKFGLFNTSLASAADYELLLRLMYRYKVKLKYIPEVLIKMRMGGKSNLSLGNRLRANIEDLQAWKINGLNPYIFTTILKPIIKLKQYWQRPVRG